jgi:hypothetical protein
MFAFSWTERFTWLWLRWLHNKGQGVYTPSPSSADVLIQHKFKNVDVWPCGTDQRAFGPQHRSEKLREEWFRTSAASKVRLALRAMCISS